MKRWQFSLIGVIFLLSGFVFYTMVSTGFFRDLEKTPVEVQEVIDIPGVEDIAVSYKDNFLILSSDDRAARREGKNKKGTLYKMTKNDDGAYDFVDLTASFPFQFQPHGISLLELDSGVYRIWAINHMEDKHTVELFDLFGDSIVHTATLENPLMVSPNDITAIGRDEFYFTNDHGYTSKKGVLAEDYLGLEASNVVYYKAGEYKVVAEDIAYANGIQYDPARNLVFVASPRKFVLKVYEREDESGLLSRIDEIYCGTGVDNIHIGPDQTIWIGCHPNLLQFTSYAAGKNPISPSEVIMVEYNREGETTMESVFRDDGELISGSTVAIPFDDMLYIGNVMDDHFVVIDLPK